MTAGVNLLALTGTFIDSHRVDLSRRLGEALAVAEQLFGPRDPQWTLLGVEIGDEDYPRTFFPSTAPNHLRVHLARNVATEIQACFQVAHEVVHLLNPVRQQETSVLEEGIAAWFSIVFSTSIDTSYPATTACIGSAYHRALDLVQPLMGCPERLRVWRLQHPDQGLSHITADELLGLYPFLARETSVALTADFY